MTYDLRTLGALNCMKEARYAIKPSYWIEFAAASFFSHRTDPKPRPEGYRDHKLSRINPEWVQAGWNQGEAGLPAFKAEVRMAFLPPDPNRVYCIFYRKPLEALQPSQTGEVPPEPSEGRGEAARGVETASLLWIEDPLQKITPNWNHPGWSNPPK